MAHEIHFPILKKLGLSEGEVLIYELLLEMGRIKARDLIVASGLGRGNVYNILTQLQTKGLVIPIEGKQTLYEAVDPSSLQKLIDQRMNRMRQTEAEFKEALSQMTSTFNLSTGRPAIQIFEGIEGAKKAIADSLTSKTEILTYLDIHAITGPLAKANRAHVKQRIQKQIPKRILVADSPAARDFFLKQNTPYTKVGFVKDYPDQFQTAMEIYDGTVTYITLTDEKQISMLIKDKNIYQMHKEQFEYFWKQASEVIDYAAASSSTDSAAGSNAM